jgi:DNA-binding NarL/FixJ family response regulator
MITDFVQQIRKNGAEVQKPSVRMDEAETNRFGLTRRETQIIGALVDGQTNKDIAGRFGISECTVKNHLTNVYDKLGVYNRVELVLFAMNQGLCGTNTVSAAVPPEM